MEQGSSGQPFYLNDSDSCTVDQIKTSDLRSLGDNVKLLAVIQNLSHDLVTKSENTYKKLDEIQRETEIKSVGVKNLINEFQMLADSQFIENRIYDADESDSPPEEFNKNIIDEENNKTPADQKILPIIHECISHSLKFIDENFNFNDKPLKQTSAESDDEEDYVKETLARAMESNPFNRTPLPAIIGSKAFFSQNIFDGGENHTENNQNDNNSTISSDRKSSLQSDNEEEDDETLFSPSKGVSIQHGIIPPPPPLPNFSYFADSRKDIEDDEDDEDEELFKQTETEPKSLQGKLPEIKPNQSWNHESDHDSDDSDDLFKPPPQMNPRKSLESTKISPTPTPNQSTSKSPEAFKPLITAQDLLSKIPQLKKNQSHDSEDDDDAELFKRVASDLKNVNKNLPEIRSNNSWNPDYDHDSDDSDDMFVPPPQVNPRKSLESSKPTIPTKPTIKSGESPRKLLEVQTINIFNSDDSDDSDDLFKPPPQVNPRKSSASGQMSTESTTKSPEVFKPIITPQDLLSKLPQLKKNQSHDSGNDETEPKIVQEKIPEIKSTPSWNDDSDDSDDMFKPSPPQVIPRKSLEPSKPSVATKPTLKSEELQRKLPDIKSNDSWKAASYFDDSDDSDDLFKLPPKVNPRKSLKSTKISTESTAKSPDVIEPSTTPRKLPELKTDPNHDREDDEESFEPTKNAHENLPESKSNPSWILDAGHDSDDSDDLFKPPPQVNPRKSLESKRLPPESTSKSPEIFKPLINPPGSLKKIPQLKTNQNYYSEDDDDEYEEIFQATQKDLKNAHKNLPEIKSNDSWNPDSDSDDSDDLFKLPPQVNPRKSIESITKPTLPTTPTVKSEEQPRKLPEITSTNTLNFASDSDDSDDLFKQPPRITPRKSSDTTSPKEVPGKLFENKFDQSWNLDSDSDDDLFKIKK